MRDDPFRAEEFALCERCRFRFRSRGQGIERLFEGSKFGPYLVSARCSRFGGVEGF
jgi:hypothetical protein